MKKVNTYADFDGDFTTGYDDFYELKFLLIINSRSAHIADSCKLGDIKLADNVRGIMTVKRIGHITRIFPNDVSDFFIKLKA